MRLLHQAVYPYELDSLHHLETISYILLVLMSVLLTGYLPPYTLATQVVLFLIVVPPTALMIWWVLRQQWHEVQQKRNNAHSQSTGSASPGGASSVVSIELQQNPLRQAIQDEQCACTPRSEPLVPDGNVTSDDPQLSTENSLNSREQSSVR